MLQSMRLQRAGHNWVTELNWTELNRVEGGSGIMTTSEHDGWLSLLPSVTSFIFAWVQLMIMQGMEIWVSTGFDNQVDKAQTSMLFLWPLCSHNCTILFTWSIHRLCSILKTFPMILHFLPGRKCLSHLTTIQGFFLKIKEIFLPVLCVLITGITLYYKG